VQLWVQAVLTGVSVGIVYGVIGVGYVVIHRITGMVNFSQGDIAMAGMFGAVVAAKGLPGPLAMLAGALTGAVIALLVYRLAIHPLRTKGVLVQTIATLGAAIVIRGIAQLIFGTEPYSLAPLTQGGSLHILGGSFALQAVWLVALVVVLFVALKLFFDKTMTGRALSACAVNRYAAGVVGINVVTMATIAFVVSGGVTGLVGAMQVPLNFATVGVGLTLALKGFIAAVLGGMDRIGLALVGGILVGIFEACSAAAISTSYQDVIVLSLLLVLLIVRPAGLTRIKVSQRV
jgi:Branched-chain amino acid ABC-type transport system, permease components